MSKASEYIRGKGLVVIATRNEQNGPQLYVELCPFCGQKGHKQRPHFVISDSDEGMYFCFRCEAKGNLWTLKKHYGDLNVDRITQGMGGDERTDALARQLTRRFHAGKQAPAAATAPREGAPAEEPKRTPNPEEVRAWEAALWGDGEAAEHARTYLFGGDPDCRSLDSEIAKRFRLGLAERHGKHWLTIPHVADGKVANVKFRSIPPDEKSYNRMAGCASVLFNADSLTTVGPRVFVVEGELDALAAYSFLPATDAVVAVTTGASAAKGQIAAYREALAPFNEVIVATDMDEPGEKAAQEIAETLGSFRCRRLKLPFKDINECLANGLTAQDFALLVQAAQFMGEAMVLPIDHYLGTLQTVIDPLAIRGVTTGFPNLDDVMGGLRAKELHIVTGHTSSGKSTFALRMALNRARSGDGVLVFTFENSPEDFVRGLAQMALGKPFGEMSGSDRALAAQMLSGMPFYFGNTARPGAGMTQNLNDAMEWGVRRYGLKLVVLDHLHFLDEIRNADDERRAIDQAVRGFKLLVGKLDIHMMVVAHPKNIPTDRDGVMRPVELADFKGSSAIQQDADLVTRVHRPRDLMRVGNADFGVALVTVLKCRSREGREGGCGFIFDSASLDYRPMDAKQLVAQMGKNKHTRGPGKGKGIATAHGTPPSAGAHGPAEHDDDPEEDART